MTPCSIEKRHSAPMGRIVVPFLKSRGMGSPSRKVNLRRRACAPRKQFRHTFFARPGRFRRSVPDGIERGRAPSDTGSTPVLRVRFQAALRPVPATGSNPIGAGRGRGGPKSAPGEGLRVPGSTRRSLARRVTRAARGPGAAPFRRPYDRTPRAASGAGELSRRPRLPRPARGSRRAPSPSRARTRRR
jgi:hypothetical protein